MADYHPVLARAVARLESNTPEARAALYDRARAAFLIHAGGMSELDSARERLALETAIRKIEDAAPQARPAPPHPATAAATKPSLSSPLHRPTTAFRVISIFFPNWWPIDVTCISLYSVARLPSR